MASLRSADHQRSSGSVCQGKVDSSWWKRICKRTGHYTVDVRLGWLKMARMARPRVYAQAGSQAGTYHVISRVVDRTLRLAEGDRERLRAMLSACARFHQVEVLTFCILGNHFHLLIRVPERPDGFDPAIDEVFALWKEAVGAEWAGTVGEHLRRLREQGNAAALEQWRQRMVNRMFGLGEFVKGLKQRFTQWYNRMHGRTGVLWEGRYRSVIVTDDGRALRTMAAYIDLNSVRAGLCEDPGDYRWSGYAEAMAGKEEALEGVATIVGEKQLPTGGGETESQGALMGGDKEQRRRHLRALVRYRVLLGRTGRTRLHADGTVRRHGLSEPVARRLRERGEGAVAVERLLKRVRQLSAGVVFGGREEVEKWFEEHRWWFGGGSGVRRQTGARRIGRKGNGWDGLFTIRDLGDR